MYYERMTTTPARDHAAALRDIAAGALDRLAGLAVGLLIAAALLAIPNTSALVRTAIDALTHPAAACAMTFNPDACLDTSTIRDLR